MAKFQVVVVSTVTTKIEVEANNAAEARKQISHYGLIEAASDYKVMIEGVTAKIRAVIPL